MILYETIINDNAYEFVIPMGYLESVDISEEQIKEIMKHDDKIAFIKELFEVPKFACSLNFSTDLNYLDQCTSLFPQKCTYSLTEYSGFNYDDETPKFLNSSIIENISLINISYIFIWWLVTEENCLLLRTILSSSNIKLCLSTIMVILNNLNDALDILEILSECKYLESVELQYVPKEGMHKFYKFATIKYWNKIL